MKCVMQILLGLLIFTVIVGCSEDESSKETIPITGLGLFDAEVFDYVVFIDRSMEGDQCETPNVGFAVLKCGTTLQSLSVSINDVPYTFEDLAAGVLWFCADIDSTLCMDDAVNNIQINASGISYDEASRSSIPVEINEMFTLENPCSSCDCAFPDSLYILSYDEFGRPVYTAQDASLSWSLTHDNQYQIITANKSDYANPRDFEMVVAEDERSYVVANEAYEDDPQHAQLTISQMNVQTNERFVAYSRCNKSKQYNGTTLLETSRPTLDEIRKTVAKIR